VKAVAITQRVAIDPAHGERRDCLDQRWSEFLLACGAVPVPIPNVPQAAQRILETMPLAGLVLTGGNDLAAYGGDAPERDATENLLLDLAQARKLPVVAVCRGMQLVQHRHGVPLKRVEGHVAARQTVSIRGVPTEVNSFHNFGATETRPPLEAWASGPGGIVKAVRIPGGNLVAMMWHPERLAPFSPRDLDLFRDSFALA
jgi:gamma-glutamyl-gamma-aminobutyrate hydrolase PuuD